MRNVRTGFDRRVEFVFASNELRCFRWQTCHVVFGIRMTIRVVTDEVIAAMFAQQAFHDRCVVPDVHVFVGVLENQRVVEDGSWFKQIVFFRLDVGFVRLGFLTFSKRSSRRGCVIT